MFKNQSLVKANTCIGIFFSVFHPNKRVVPLVFDLFCFVFIVPVNNFSVMFTVGERK